MASLRGLVCGSIAPDLVYFVPIGISRSESHSLLGVLSFCLPASLLVFALFRVLVEPFAAWLAPQFVRLRLPNSENRPECSVRAFAGVVLSVLVGALTHVVWDSFCHADGALVRAIPLLRVNVTSIGGYHVFTYKLFQHGSTLAGAALLAYWFHRWIENTTPRALSPSASSSTCWRTLLLTTMVALPASVGLLAGSQVEEQPTMILAAQGFLGAAIRAGGAAFGAVLLISSVGWSVGRILGD